MNDGPAHNLQRTAHAYLQHPKTTKMLLSLLSSDWSIQTFSRERQSKAGWDGFKKLQLSQKEPVYFHDQRAQVTEATEFRLYRTQDTAKFLQT